MTRDHTTESKNPGAAWLDTDRGDVIVVDGVTYVRAYPVAHGRCRHCGNSHRWTPAAIINALREHTPRSAAAWRKSTATHPDTVTVRRVFGTWNGALDAAGVARNAPGFPPYWTAARIIEAIVRWAHDHDGRPPTCEQWEKATPATPCVKVVRDRFGTWNNALDAAGFFRRGSHGKRLPERLSQRQERIGKVEAAPIAEALRREIAAGSTIGSLATECDVDETYIARIVAGKTTAIRTDFADRIICAIDRPDVELIAA